MNKKVNWTIKYNIKCKVYVGYRGGGIKVGNSGGLKSQQQKFSMVKN